MEAPGGVDQHLVEPLGAGRGDGVEDHCGRIGALLLMDDRRADAPGPHLELLDRSGAEGVGGRENHGAPLLLAALGELGGGGGLAGAVDPDQDRYPGALPSGRDSVGRVRRFEEGEQSLPDRRTQLVGGRDVPPADLLAQLVDQAERELDAGVRRDQGGLQAIERDRLDGPGAAEGLARLFQELGVGHEETALELAEKTPRHPSPASRGSRDGPAAGSGELLCEGSGGAAEAVQGLCLRGLAINDEHHMVAVGERLRQRDQAGACEDDARDASAAAGGGHGVEVAHEDAVVRALDLEPVGVAGASHPIDGLTFRVDEDGTECLWDVGEEVAEEGVEGHQEPAAERSAGQAATALGLPPGARPGAPVRISPCRAVTAPSRPPPSRVRR